jgi:hypothetical protein
MLLRSIFFKMLKCYNFASELQNIKSLLSNMFENDITILEDDICKINDESVDKYDVKEAETCIEIEAQKCQNNDYVYIDATSLTKYVILFHLKENADIWNVRLSIDKTNLSNDFLFFDEIDWHNYLNRVNISILYLNHEFDPHNAFSNIRFDISMNINMFIASLLKEKIEIFDDKITIPLAFFYLARGGEIFPLYKFEHGFIILSNVAIFNKLTYSRSNDKKIMRNNKDNFTINDNMFRFLFKNEIYEKNIIDYVPILAIKRNISNEFGWSHVAAKKKYHIFTANENAIMLLFEFKRRDTKLHSVRPKTEYYNYTSFKHNVDNSLETEIRNCSKMLQLESHSLMQKIILHISRPGGRVVIFDNDKDEIIHKTYNDTHIFAISLSPKYKIITKLKERFYDFKKVWQKEEDSLIIEYGMSLEVEFEMNDSLDFYDKAYSFVCHDLL